MQNLRFAMAAGETKLFEIAGRYLEIIDATGPVSIELFDANGGQSDDARDVLSGTYMTEAYSRFSVYSATAQTLELFLSSRGGGTKRQPGNVRVIDEIGVNIQSMTGGPAAAIGFSTQQLLAPAANTKGFVIRSIAGYVQSGAAGVTNMRIVASPTAPTDTNPGPQRLWMADVMSVNGLLVPFQFPFVQRSIPAGWGIWVAAATINQALQQGQVFMSGEAL